MNAPILKPGDAVHIMVPVRPQHLPKDRFEEASQAQAAAYMQIFARYGVYVDSWTGSDSIDEVKVVAIFRKDENV